MRVCTHFRFFLDDRSEMLNFLFYKLYFKSSDGR